MCELWGAGCGSLISAWGWVLSHFIVHHLPFLGFIPLFLLSIIIITTSIVVVIIIVLISGFVISIIFYFFSLIKLFFLNPWSLPFLSNSPPWPWQGGLEWASGCMAFHFQLQLNQTNSIAMGWDKKSDRQYNLWFCSCAFIAEWIIFICSIWSMIRDNTRELCFLMLSIKLVSILLFVNYWKWWKIK